MKALIIFLLFTNSIIVHANQTCSRVATINYQNVLVDAGSNKRGEGLRFYLEKDPASKTLLNEYQEKDKPTIFSASASTAGSILILSGLLQTNQSSGIQNSNTLIYGGALLVALSYLTSKTLQFSNEKILKEAVDQYNKRNTPRIYFSPYKDNNGNSSVGFGMQQEF
jgi:hypothetical protein